MRKVALLIVVLLTLVGFASPNQPQLNKGILSSIVNGISHAFHSLFGNKDDEKANVETPKPLPKKKWTVMVYIAADNNLEQAAFINLNMLEIVGSSDQVNFLCLVDRAKGEYNGDGDWTDARIFYIKKDNDQNKVTSPVVKFLNEVNTGDPHTLYNFMEFCKEYYPAEHYFLILWNHGSGWESVPSSSVNTPLKNRMVAYDDQAKDSITMPELKSVLRKFNSEIGKKIDILGFDACLMGMIEVAYDLKDFAQTLIVSEKTEYGLGWPYHAFADIMVKKPNLSPAEVASVVPEAFKEFYNYLSTHYNKDLTNTLAALDATKIKNIEKAFKAFIDKASNLMEDKENVVKLLIEARKAAVQIDDPIKAHTDIGSFVKEAAKRIPELKEEADAVIEALKEAELNFVVTGKEGGEEHEHFKNATGLAIYFPLNPKALDPDIIRKYLSVIPYDDFTFVQDTNWNEFLFNLIMNE